MDDVGILTFDFYNGAASTGQCHRLAAALRSAVAQDTRVLVLQGGAVFCNGIHLNVIEGRRDPAAEAWRNINAIDDVCREIITATRQLVVASLGGNAGELDSGLDGFRPGVGEEVAGQPGRSN